MGPGLQILMTLVPMWRISFVICSQRISRDGEEVDILSLLQHSPAIVMAEENLFMKAIPIEKEIYLAIVGLGLEAAPRPDSFPGIFYVRLWDLIKHDVCDAVCEFFEGHNISRSIASVFITLIPKTSSISTFSDSRAISLCNFINKIFTRIIADRLKPLLSKLISPKQSTFLSGRDIFYNILLAQDALQFLSNRRGHPNVVFNFYQTRGNTQMWSFKIDLCKAFVRISWSFLRRLLLALRFYSDFVNLILHNLSASFFSLMAIWWATSKLLAA